MFNKIKEWSGVVAIIALIGVLLIPSRGQETKLGNATASFQDAALGFRVNGVEVISQNAVVDGVLGGSVGALSITTSTTFASNFDCQYDVIVESTSTAAQTWTLPAATSTAATCLVADGTQEQTLIQLATGNNFNVTLATSTGDSLFYNATSTAGAAVLATSSAGSSYLLTAFRVNSSSVSYIISNYGTAH